MADDDNGRIAKLAAGARELIAPAAIAIAIVVLWHVVVVAFEVPEAILPTPVKVAETMVLQSDLLLQHSWPTTRECVIGFLLAVAVGMGLGILMAFSRLFRTGVYPLVVAFQVVPKVALAPLFIVWFGLGTTNRLMLAFVIAFFPMVVNTFAGIQGTDPVMIRMARAFSASRWTIFRDIEFPNALPYIFSGLKIGITLAVIGIIVAEFVTAQEGLGYLIVFAEGNVDTPVMMAAIIVLSVLGVLLYVAVVLLEKLIVRWDVGQQL